MWRARSGTRNALDEGECEDLVSSIEEKGGKAAYRAADLSIETETARAFDAAVEFLGDIDGLFAVAGGSGRRFGDGPAHQMTLEGWEKAFELNAFPDVVLARRVIPVARGLDAVSAPRLVEALRAGGIHCIEITVEGEGGVDTISSVARDGMTVGAGTVTTVEQAVGAVDAGAEFLVSPHLDSTSSTGRKPAMFL